MNLIILDMEWNQPIGRKNMVTDPVPLPGEVIRIGAVRTDESMEEHSRFNLCVRPAFYKKLNFAVGKVTGLEGASISYGLPFPEAYRRFVQWCGDEPVIFTWGTEDEKIMLSNLAVHGMKNVLPPYFDMQAIFSRRIAKDGKQYGVSAVLERYGLEQDLKAHDALNDAIYTHRIARCMELAQYIGEYSQIEAEIAEERKRLREERYCRTFEKLPGRDAVTGSRKIIMCRCPECRSKLKRSSFKADRDDRNILRAEAVCENCGKFAITIAITPNEDGTVSAQRRFERISK